MTHVRASLEARIIHSFLDSMPDFTPATGEEEDRTEQARFYSFVKSVYARATENPGILGLSNLHEDDAYPNRFNKSVYGKPALALNIRRASEAVDAFFAFMAEAGAAGTIRTDALILPTEYKIPPMHKRTMEIVGLTVTGNRITSEKWPGMFNAWKMLSYPCKGEVALLKRTARMERCAFVENAPGLKGTFTRLIGEGAATLTAWLEAHGYARETAIIDKEIIALRFTKGGIGAQFLYDNQTKVPAYMALIQRDWQALLPKYDAMSRVLKALVADKNGRCNHCGFCTQRNRSARPPHTVTIEIEGNQAQLCPLSPQYHFVFESLDAKKVAGIIECLRFMENNLSPEKEEKREDNLRMFRL